MRDMWENGANSYSILTPEDLPDARGLTRPNLYQRPITMVQPLSTLSSCAGRMSSWQPHVRLPNYSSIRQLVMARGEPIT